MTNMCTPWSTWRSKDTVKQYHRKIYCIIVQALPELSNACFDLSRRTLYKYYRGIKHVHRAVSHPILFSRKQAFQGWCFIYTPFLQSHHSSSFSTQPRSAHAADSFSTNVLLWNCMPCVRQELTSEYSAKSAGRGKGCESVGSLPCFQQQLCLFQPVAGHMPWSSSQLVHEPYCLFKVTLLQPVLSMAQNRKSVKLV